MFVKQVDEQGLSGSIEDAGDEFADHGGDDFVAGLGGAVEVGAVALGLAEVLFALEDVHHGHDCGVGDSAALTEGFIDLADGGEVALPDQLHDFEFLAGEGGAGTAHTN